MDIQFSKATALAYVLGVYLGDGNVTKNGSGFRLNVVDRDFALTTKSALEKLTKNDVLFYNYKTPGRDAKNKPYKNHFELYLTDRVLCRKLTTWTEYKKKIPQEMKEAGRKQRIYFVAGLMDSEGYVGRVNRSKDPTQKTETNRGYYIGFKSTDPWVDDFANLLRSLGVRPGKIGIERNKGQTNRKQSKRFTVNIQSWIDAGCFFSIKRKQERVNEWRSADAYTMRSLRPRGGPKRTCSITGCSNLHVARGYCNKHYKRLVRG